MFQVSKYIHALEVYHSRKAKFCIEVLCLCAGQKVVSVSYSFASHVYVSASSLNPAKVCVIQSVGRTHVQRISFIVRKEFICSGVYHQDEKYSVRHITVHQIKP